MDMQSFSLHTASTRPRHDSFYRALPVNRSLGRSISFGPFRLYPGARVVERDGARLALGSRALDILICLTERAGEVISHKELTQRVWRGLVVTPSSLRVHVAGLRKALSECEGEFRYIANIPGQGYCFVAPIRRIDSDELSDSAPEPPQLSTLPSGPILEAVKRRMLAPEVESAELPSRSQPAQRKHTLPNQLTSFIEHKTGSGKTRLATQAIAEILDRFANGCWLVELAPSGGPMQVVQTTANALGVPKHGTTSLDTEDIVERRATKCFLLVLDNDDQVCL